MRIPNAHLRDDAKSDILQRVFAVFTLSLKKKNWENDGLNSSVISEENGTLRKYAHEMPMRDWDVQGFKGSSSWTFDGLDWNVEG